MTTRFLIHLQSADKALSENIELLHTKSWNGETEQQLIRHIQDMIAVVRKDSCSMQLLISIDTDEFDCVYNSIQKKLELSKTEPEPKLSRRENEVLELIKQGYTNKEISDRLFISFETARSHRKKIMLKTRTFNTASLITFCHQSFL